ncbi:MAG: hypothetical protein HXY40_09850 [Chloroflexi bacterium]|nr:hypothetical protein [Chloroflexota bacterium]
MEKRCLDRKEQHEAFSRITLARGFDAQVLIPFDFWVDDSQQQRPIWQELLRSLQLGRCIADPTKGVTLH